MGDRRRTRRTRDTRRNGSSRSGSRVRERERVQNRNRTRERSRVESRARVQEIPERRKSRTKVTGFYDYSLLVLVLILVCFGLIMIYSTSYYSASMYKNGDSMYYLKRQGLLAFAGIMAMLGISCIDYRILLKKIPKFNIYWPTFIYGFSILLQLYVLINGVELNGAKRWISLGPLGTFQPSDFAKIATIIFVSYLIYLRPRELDHVKGFVRIALYIVVLIGLIGIENMSTAIVIAMILFGICYVASKKKWYYYIGILVVFVFGALYIVLGEGFRMQRIEIWLNVETHEDSYQILQGLYAIASGGVFGKGLGQSMQKLGYVPEAQNDMIFSIICEELGIFGACCILLLFIMLLWRIFQITINAPDLFGGLICTGVLVHIAVQVIINIAVVTNSIPSTGVPLPFISYGGTSVAMLLVEIGIVLSVSKRITAE